MYILRDAGKVDEATVERVKAYLKESRVTIPTDRVPAALGNNFYIFLLVKFFLSQ